MKNLVVLLFPILFVMCTNDDSNIVPPNISASDVQGVWIVSFFEERNVNETNDFNGYTFDFKTDGTISATKGTVTVGGTWTIQAGSDPGEPNELVIALNTLDKPLEELNDDWDVMVVNPTKIELREISGGDGHLEQLHFTKQ